MTNVRLIGVPHIVAADGAVRDLRGQKPWAVLARIVLADGPLSRRALSSELFPDAADPLGSLRWCLAELRRALGDASVLSGDPVRPKLPDGIRVDVLSIETLDLDTLGTGEFLQGVDPACGPEFDTWLLVARQQVASRIDARLHQRAVAALSRRRADDAVRLAELAARRSPFDERTHVLLLKSLIAADHQAAAQAHVERVEALFRAELRREPSAALRSAARSTVAEPPPGVPAGARVQVLLDAGRAALTAGAVDAGIDCLRRAAACADDDGATELRAEARFALGNALVHSLRGFDDEGVVMLGQAVELARSCGLDVLASAALLEIGYADTLAGRRQAAAEAYRQALPLAGDDVAAVAGVLAHQALNLADWGRDAESVEVVHEARRLAERSGDRQRLCHTLALGAWALLRAGMLDEAEEWAGASRALARDLRWVSFEPFPLLLLAECELVAGRSAGRRADLERVFAMSCQLQDPCWEGGAARLLAMHHAAAGDQAEALRWIRDGRERSTRVSDTWVAMIGEILLTEARLCAAAGDAAAADAATREAVAFAARAQLDGTLARALQVLRAG
jgi:DNA-binding SARP family transcriptional activator